MVSVPYNAMIIAHERMNIFAWISIIEVSMKLLIVFMLQWFGFDRLKFYAILMFGVALLIRFIYGIYCSRKFSESKFHFYWDKPLFKTLTSYAGWNLWGNSADVVMSEGVNILLNIFFGPVVNAARGIAYQVRGAANQFVRNFQIAMNPQIIKSFATDDLKNMHQLIIQGAKFSYYLLFTLTLPIIIETEIILKLWLRTVPEYTVIFTRLVLINILIDSISGPLMTAAQASGKIKLYQSVVGGLLILNLPFSYLCLKIGFSPEVTIYISISISIIALFLRLLIVKHLVHLQILDFIKKVILKSFIVSIISTIPPLIYSTIVNSSFFRLLIVSFFSVIITLNVIYLIGLNKNEKSYISKIVTNTYSKFKSHNNHEK